MHNLTFWIISGYDDLETVKLIEEKDLHVIGVQNYHHVKFLLNSVQVWKLNYDFNIVYLHCFRF